MEWRAVEVGQSWGVESRCGDQPSQLMVVGLSKGHAMKMVREIMARDLEEAREAFISSGGQMEDDGAWYGDND